MTTMKYNTNTNLPATLLFRRGHRRLAGFPFDSFHGRQLILMCRRLHYGNKEASRYQCSAGVKGAEGCRKRSRAARPGWFYGVRIAYGLDAVAESLFSRSRIMEFLERQFKRCVVR